MDLFKVSQLQTTSHLHAQTGKVLRQQQVPTHDGAPHQWSSVPSVCRLLTL